MGKSSSKEQTEFSKKIEKELDGSMAWLPNQVPFSGSKVSVGPSWVLMGGCTPTPQPQPESLLLYLSYVVSFCYRRNF